MNIDRMTEAALGLGAAAATAIEMVKKVAGHGHPWDAQRAAQAMEGIDAAVVELKSAFAETITVNRTRGADYLVESKRLEKLVDTYLRSLDMQTEAPNG